MLKALRHMQELLEHPRNWIKGYSYGVHSTREADALCLEGETYDGGGLRVVGGVPVQEADCYCLFGALGKATPAGSDVRSEVAHLLNAETKSGEHHPDGLRFSWVPKFNDHNTTTHVDVLRLLASVVEKQERKLRE